MRFSFSDTTSFLSFIWKYKLITIAGVKLTLGSLLVALILLLFSSRLSKMVVRLIERRLIHRFVDDKNSQVTYGTFAFYGCLAGFVTLSLTIAGIPLTVFTVLGGALAIGVGFGSQNIVNNFISGIILLVEQPVRVGDIVELDNVLGTVLSINTRSTKIKNADGKIFIVPNSFFLEKTVLNASYESTNLRNIVNFSVAYGSDVQLIENICMDLMLNTEGIEQGPVPQVIFNNFGESTLDFQMIFWCNIDKVTPPLVKSNLRYKLDMKFREHKIEMAFPQRDINLKLNKSLDVKLLS